ncbi:cupin domain-containing protein [Colwellia sp. TT2012]|uniref:cupin domain-containing protein n=1 Tax=Colwellia sp. TT2012 TaxID=1720342 RepID=UPI00070F3496|nr:cupin domain-containing protein [Colwellia sp. TT2012]
MDIKNLKEISNWRKKDHWPSDFTTEQLQTATFCLDNNSQVLKHKHHKEDNFWYIVSGKGTVLLGDEEFEVIEGDSFIIPKGVVHSAKTDSNHKMRILQVECVVYSKSKPVVKVTSV